MDRGGPGQLLTLALLSCALGATSCVTDANAFFYDFFTPAPSPRPIDELVDPAADIPARELFYGVGGRELVPRTDVAYKLIEKDTSGFSPPNFELEDPSGRRWDAKFAEEVKPEVAASRLLWAIGFHQAPVYYVREWRVANGPDAGPQPEARFRYEDPAWKGDGVWSWESNPFVGTRELNGLIVMNVLMNNWDIKASNNKKYKLRGPDSRRIYVVKDLGQSFGHSVRKFMGSQGNPQEFREERLIREVNGDEVEFEFQSVFIGWNAEDGLHVDDVLWTCRRLAQLSDRQWSDAFRAAGYSESEGAAYIEQMKRKMQEGLALEQRARS